MAGHFISSGRRLGGLRLGRYEQFDFYPVFDVLQQVHGLCKRIDRIAPCAAWAERLKGRATDGTRTPGGLGQGGIQVADGYFQHGTAAALLTDQPDGFQFRRQED